MLSAYLRDIAFPLYPEQDGCFIAHEVENAQAIGASQAAGFRYLHGFAEDGFQAALLVFERGKNA